MLRITAQEEADHVRLRIEGRLAGSEVSELERCWREHACLCAHQAILIDLTAVTFVDASGKELLAAINRRGDRLIADGVMTRALVDEIARER